MLPRLIGPSFHRASRVGAHLGAWNHGGYPCPFARILLSETSACAANCPSSRRLSTKAPARKNGNLPLPNGNDQSTMDQLGNWPALTNLSIQIIKLYQIYGKDHVLLVRVGSFYEMYGEQAARWAEALGLKLTRKGSCGFPDYVLEQYVCKLVNDHAQRVAVIDQVCDDTSSHQLSTAVPFQDVAKARVKGLDRYLKRIYSPGTMIGSGGDSQYLAAIYVHMENLDRLVAPKTAPVTVTFCDLTSYETNFVTTDIAGLPFILNGVNPVEILLSDRHLACQVDLDKQEAQQLTSLLPEGSMLTLRPHTTFTECNPRAEEILQRQPMVSVKSLGTDIANERNTEVGSKDAVFAEVSGKETRNAIASYLHFAFSGHAPKLAPSTELSETHAVIDKWTAAHLELFRTYTRGSRVGSVVAFMDQTITRGGERALKRSLQFPLIDQGQIERRLNCLEQLRARPDKLDTIRSHLDGIKHLVPLEEICARLESDAAGFTDLKSLVELLQCTQGMNQTLEELHAFSVYEISDFRNVLAEMHSALSFDTENPIRRGHSTAYDQCVDANSALMQKSDALRLQFCQQFGLSPDGRTPEFRDPGTEGNDPRSTQAVIEVTPAQYRAISASDEGAEVIRLSATKTRVRLMYKPWSVLTTALFEVRTQIRELEMRIIQTQVQKVKREVLALNDASRFINDVDMMQGLCKVADEFGCTRPKISQSWNMDIVDGFHPVVAESAITNGRRVIPNDARFNDDVCVCIVSGPNMGGKSSYLRMVGVCALIAQIGSPVPAAAATMPIFDGVYTRFGSSDDISCDQSTFFSELSELGRILAAATSKSLVLVDELGRGTSPEDATALFAAVVRHLVRNRIPALMTTHLHDLENVLKDSLSSAEFAKVQFLQSRGKPVRDAHGRESFIVDYKLVSGMAPKSHGLEIAGWSQIPKPILEDALQIREQYLAKRTS